MSSAAVDGLLFIQEKLLQEDEDRFGEEADTAIRKLLCLPEELIVSLHYSYLLWKKYYALT